MMRPFTKLSTAPTDVAAVETRLLAKEKDSTNFLREK